MLKCKFLKKSKCILTKKNCDLYQILNTNPINSRLLIQRFSDCYQKNPTRGFWLSAITQIGEKLHNGNGYSAISKNPLEPHDTQKILSYLEECDYSPNKAIIPQLWTDLFSVFNLV